MIEVKLEPYNIWFGMFKGVAITVDLGTGDKLNISSCCMRHAKLAVLDLLTSIIVQDKIKVIVGQPFAMNKSQFKKITGKKPSKETIEQFLIAVRKGKYKDKVELIE